MNNKELKEQAIKEVNQLIETISKMECQCPQMDTVCDRCRALSSAIHAKDSLERL